MNSYQRYKALNQSTIVCFIISFIYFIIFRGDPPERIFYVLALIVFIMQFRMLFPFFGGRNLVKKSFFEQLKYDKDRGIITPFSIIYLLLILNIVSCIPFLLSIGGYI